MIIEMEELVDFFENVETLDPIDLLIKLGLIDAFCEDTSVVDGKWRKEIFDYVDLKKSIAEMKEL